MEGTWLLSPPVALIVVLAAAGLLSLALSRLAFRPKSHTGGETKSYACGEDLPDPRHMIQPDYGQFFPFAFFFTILHVVALMATTVPATTTPSLVLALVYVAGAIVGLTILFRK